MVNWTKFYFSFMESLFVFFTMELFVSYKNKNDVVFKKNLLRFCYLIFTIIYAFLPSATGDNFLYFFSQFVYIYLRQHLKCKRSILTFIKLEAYLIASTVFLYIFHSILFRDSVFLDNSILYFEYKSLICAAMTYLVLCLYVYGKRLFTLRVHRLYSITFGIAAVLAIFILSFLSFQLVSGTWDIKEYLPVIVSFIFIIGAIFLNAYNQMILSFETQLQQKQLLTKYELELKYYEDIDSSMKKISSLRHDFKNHLIILSGYAKKGDLNKLQQYLDKICDASTETKLIQTSNTLVSSILNTKAADCIRKGISFDCNCCFETIFIPDFYLITILGNMLDNAIEAAGKRSDGFIHIYILQADSFLKISCHNNHHETIRRKESVFISTKAPNDMFHGIGIKNIQDAAAARNGTVDIQYDSSNFHIIVVLPNYS